MVTPANIAQELRDLLGSEVDARVENGRLRILTPFEYPDGDGVVVLVGQDEEGRYVISDGGAADATLAGKLGSRVINAPATEIASRFDAVFAKGQLTTTVGVEASIVDACQRIARAAASVAEAATYLRRPAPRTVEFVDVVAAEMRQREISAESERKLRGASGHDYTASLFVPDTETVIEPIGGENTWNVARAVYVEFGDLSKVNGYRLMAVLDDREADLGPDVPGLLSQVADVASWRQHDSWIAELGSR